MTATVTGSQRLIPGVVARVIGLLRALQDDVYYTTKCNTVENSLTERASEGNPGG
jgi:hypothetical protein